ncbi:putative RING-H2 finger protein ATL69 [Impatiens glandulifera]|uniref:putative RING-H2 finger protein ATL69 n=1 Tax=Impatiens glandulifera TaxID=253017 RepID=UPI001FB09E08|nr:putative RING-H2 finger protein ATL69 [Impatiens glandulifera]
MTTPVAATDVGLGYGIAIAIMILILISTITLTSYACFRAYGVAGHGAGESGRVLPLELTTAVDNVHVVGESMRLPPAAAVKEGPCSICLADYRPLDTVRCIPDCNHCFHANCVDHWLRLSFTCPLCRNSPDPLTLVSPPHF